MENDMTRSENRLVHYDLLRIFSIFCMMFLHVSASNWSNQPINSFNWQVFNVYDSFVRFCVPIFVMISGMFFLDPHREYTIKKIFTKNIFRIITCYIFWSGFYAVVWNLLKYKAIHWKLIKGIIWSFLIGHYHLWFLFMLVGLYLIVPLLRKITESKQLTQYFLLLAFLFTFIVPTIARIPLIEDIMTTILAQTHLHFVLGYSGYFMAGYYINTYGIPKGLQKVVYILGIVSWAITMGGTYYISLKSGKASVMLYDELLPTICFTALTVFSFFKNVISKINFSPRQIQGILTLSQLSFGMYLVHAAVNTFFLDSLEWTTLSFNPIFSVPVLTVAVFSISFVIAYILKKIPILGRYIL